MALYSRREFYELCGVSKAYLTNYIKRGKVILTGNMVDDTIAENRTFMETRVNKGEKEQKPKPPKFEDIPLDDEEKQELKDLSLRKKILDTKKVEEEVTRLQLTNSKLRGEAIPVELVKNVIAQLSKSVISAFKDGADALLTEIAHSKKLSNAEHARLRGVLVDIVNGSTNNAIQIANKDIKKLASDYSVKKGRGEASTMK